MKQRLDFFFDLTFSILLLSLSLSFALPNIFLIVLIFMFFLKKEKQIKFSLPLKLLILFICYIFFKALLFGNFLENINLYKHYLVIVALVLLSNYIKNRSIVIFGFFSGVLFAIFYSSTKMVTYYFKNSTLPLGNTGEVYDFLHIHRPYFGFMCLISVILIDYLRKSTRKKTEKKLYIFAIFIIVIFLFIIVARLSLFLVIIFFFLKFVKGKNTKKKKVGFIFAFIALIVICSTNKNLVERLHIKSSFVKTIEVIKNQEPRFVIWNCVRNQIINKEFNMFFGYDDYKTIQEKLNKCYYSSINNESKKKYYLKSEFNTHSQFYDILLNGGLIGFLLFILPFIFIIKENSNFNIFFILVSVLLFLALENLFHRQLGVYLFGFIVFLVNNKLYEEKQDYFSY